MRTTHLNVCFAQPATAALFHLGWLYNVLKTDFLWGPLCKEPLFDGSWQLKLLLLNILAGAGATAEKSGSTGAAGSPS